MLNFFRTGGIFLQFLPTHFFAKTKLIWFPQILKISTTIESGLLPGSAVSEGSDEPLSGAPESDLALHTWPIPGRKMRSFGLATYWKSFDIAINCFGATRPLFRRVDLQRVFGSLHGYPLATPRFSSPHLAPIAVRRRVLREISPLNPYIFPETLSSDTFGNGLDRGLVTPG